jgi:hypothetical protein
MDHAVHYRTSAGDTRLEEVGSLEAAVSLVERLRNDEGVSDVRVYKQVPIEFKTYYKVTVVGSDAGANGEAVSATPASAPAPGPQPAAQATPSAAPQDPPPGAMPLGPSTPSPQPAAQPSAQPSAQPAQGEGQGQGDEGEGSRRGSLFSRG